MSAVHRLGDVVIGHKCEVDNCLLPAMDGQSRCYEHSEDRLIEDLFRGENCRFGGVNCTVQATACNEDDVPMCESCHNVYRRIQRGRTIGQIVGPHNELIRIDEPELLPPNHRWPQRPREGTLRYNGRRMRNDELLEAMNQDMMNRMNRLREAATSRLSELREQQPQGVLSDIVASGEVRTSLLGNTYRYFGDGPNPAVVPLVPNPAAQPPPTGVHPTDMGHETDEELCECNNLEHSEFNEECPLNNVGEVCWGLRERIEGEERDDEHSNL